MVEFGHKIVSDMSIKSLLAAVVVATFWVFPEQDMHLFLAIFILLLIDTATGLIKAWNTKDINSRQFFRAPLKCFVYFILLMSGALLDKVMIGSMGFPLALPIIKTFLAATEMISIMENLAVLGFPLPTTLISKLKDVNDGTDKKAS